MGAGEAMESLVEAYCMFWGSVAAVLQRTKTEVVKVLEEGRNSGDFIE